MAALLFPKDGTDGYNDPVPQGGCGTGPKDPSKRQRTRHEIWGTGSRAAQRGFRFGLGREAKVGVIGEHGTSGGGCPPTPPLGSGTIAERPRPNANGYTKLHAVRDGDGTVAASPKRGRQGQNGESNMDITIPKGKKKRDTKERGKGIGINRDSTYTGLATAFSAALGGNP